VNPGHEELRGALTRELVELFLREGFIVHGARGVEPFKAPPTVQNDGYGKQKPRTPDVVCLDKTNNRIVFGLVRTASVELDSEDSLEEYNVFLDHKAGQGDQASILYVMLPPQLIADFTGIITHYIHREYWHRIIPVTSKTTV